MSARIIDVKAVAARVREQVAREVAGMDAKPGLATVLVGDDPASAVYVRMKREDSAEVGIESFHHEPGGDVSADELAGLLRELNEDERVHGILLQLPLPGGLDPAAAVDRIDYRTDVDGLTPASAGRLSLGRPTFVPCTALGVQLLLAKTGTKLRGARAVVVGRSNLVGRPASILLSLKSGPPNPLSAAGEALPADATVTLCHTGTADIGAATREADVLIIAAGVAGYITGDMVKPGATVIDVGMNRNDAGKLVGDVDFASASEVAGAITPVPGGVGPMTVAMLLVNTLTAARRYGAV
jgi:methylenetetrahydrofolate dehydrogenase (NADP+)/methenyltetrahydrofolate cyclohydrolase